MKVIYRTVQEYGPTRYGSVFEAKLVCGHSVLHRGSPKNKESFPSVKKCMTCSFKGEQKENEYPKFSN